MRDWVPFPCFSPPGQDPRLSAGMCGSEAPPALCLAEPVSFQPCIPAKFTASTKPSGGRPGQPQARRQAERCWQMSRMLSESTAHSAQPSPHAHAYPLAYHHGAPRASYPYAHCTNEKTEAWLGKASAEHPRLKSRSWGLIPGLFQC